MKIESYFVGMIGTNCYLVCNEETKEAILVDPGDCKEKLLNGIKESGCELKAILLTHGHIDHMYGLSKLLPLYDVPVYALDLEEDVLRDEELNASYVICVHYTFDGATYVSDGDVLHLIGYDFKVMHTPGHTQGSCCYYVESEKVLFSGDTLFHGSAGRTDFPTGNGGDMSRSLKEKLALLPDDVKVFPGHMSATEMGFEKKNNPFF